MESVPNPNHDASYELGDLFLHGTAPGPPIFRVSDDDLYALGSFLQSKPSENVPNPLPLKEGKHARQYHPSDAGPCQVYRSKFDRETIRRLQPVHRGPVLSVPGTNPILDADRARREREEDLFMEQYRMHHPEPPLPPEGPYEEEEYIEKC